MTQYVIYPTKSMARFRRWFITADARAANFLNPDEYYYELINHPTEDQAAIEVVTLDSVTTANGLPTQRYDYSIFFTPQEMARAVNELPADWMPKSLIDDVF